MATLEGNWLIVPPDSKTGRERAVLLTPELKKIFQEMQSSWNVNKKPRSIQDYYSKQFKKACEQIGLDRHFHNLRDTYATRQWLITGDIYVVSKKIGHTSVTMTQKYANIDLRRLVQDFPSLREQVEKRVETPNFTKVDTQMVDTTGAIA